MTAVSPAVMNFNQSDNDLARHLGLLGEHLDPSLSQEFSGLPSVDFSALMNPEVPPSTDGDHKQMQLSRSVENGDNDDLSDAASDSDSDAESVDSDGNAEADTRPRTTTPALQGSLNTDLPTSGAVPASSSLGVLPGSSAMMPLRATSPPPLRVSHTMPQTSQGFVALTDINTASGQTNSQSLSSSPSSAHGEGVSNMLSSAKVSHPAAILGKRKAEQSELDTILDPAEKKKQRRLAKNRATAALSRERKKAQLQVLQQRVRVLEQENSSLSQVLSMRDAEIRRLKDRATGQTKGARSRTALGKRNANRK